MAVLDWILELSTLGAASRFAAVLQCPFVIFFWLRKDSVKINICCLQLSATLQLLVGYMMWAGGWMKSCDTASLAPSVAWSWGL